MSNDSYIRQRAKKHGFLFWKPRGNYCYRLYDPLTGEMHYGNTTQDLEQYLPVTWGLHNSLMADARRQALASRMEEWRAKKKAG